jgi:rhodanese-related sulfurtransferase
LADESRERTYEPDEPFERVDVDRTRALLDSGALLLDVREPDEYAAGHIPGARLVPLGSLLASPRSYLDRDGVVFVCAVGARSALACEMAAAVGLTRVFNLEGGTVAWAQRGLPLER